MILGAFIARFIAIKVVRIASFSGPLSLRSVGRRAMELPSEFRQSFYRQRQAIHWYRARSLKCKALRAR